MKKARDRSLLGAPVSADDRALARRALKSLRTPAEVALQENGSETGFAQVVDSVALLLDTARPLSADLRRLLAPWLTEVARRRRQVLREASKVLNGQRASTRGARA